MLEPNGIHIITYSEATVADSAGDGGTPPPFKLTFFVMKNNEILKI
jgi:hypothetical protein